MTKTIGPLCIAALAALLGGCNAIFDIHDGLPWPSGCNDDAFMIDDLEDADEEICESGMRHGAWFTASDGTSRDLSPPPGQRFTPTKIPGGRSGSRYAAHMSGSDFTNWGALMGFNLNVQGLANEPYSASAAGGIRFWMKSSVPIVVRLPIQATIPSGAAGACVDDAESRNCNNHFEFVIRPPDPGQWVEYSVPFSAFMQSPDIDANGNFRVGSALLNPDELIGIQFVAPAVSFDVWVDDVRFYPCVDADCTPTCVVPEEATACPAMGDIPAACWPTGASCAAVPVLASGFTGVWGSGPGDVWAVGTSLVKPVATVAHWNGIAWSRPPTSPLPTLTAVWGSGPDDVWAVGDHGATVRWRGSTWDAESITMESLQSVWGSGPNDIWAVGHAGTILRWDGAVWSKSASPTTFWLFAVWGNGADDVWAVGASETFQAGVILHWNGARWSPVQSGAPQPLFGVWSSAPDDAWAVGAGIVHWNGTAWSEVPRPMDSELQPLLAIWGSGRDDVWAVGFAGSILHWDGTDWSPEQSNTTSALIRIWGSGPDAVWAVGELGTIVRRNGTAWTVVPATAIQ